MTDSVGIAVGEQAPDVTATLVRPIGGTEPISLSELVDDRPVLLSFYPMDFSPDCIREWCAFRDFEWFASGEEVEVVGVSRADVRTHRRFATRFSLGYPLFFDRDGSVADRYGVCYQAANSSTAVRSCFLVDESREVKYRWIGEERPDPPTALPLGEMHQAIRQEFGAVTDTFGLV